LSRFARALTLATLAITALVSAAGVPSAGAGSDPGWPRQYTDGTAKLVVYQPQIDTWKNFRRLDGRFAVALTPAKSGPTFYGAVRIEAETTVNIASRLVEFSKFSLAETTYPAAAPEDAKRLAALTQLLFPKEPPAVALARVLAYMDTDRIQPRQTAVSLEPPPILVSTQPAVLVIVDGEPVLYAIDGTDLEKVVNTNWDLFFDKKGQRFYLRDQHCWFSAKTLDAAWKPEKKMPQSFQKLPATDAYREVRETAASPASQPPLLILVTQKPTELIVLEGPASARRVPGTQQLMWVANTASDLFYEGTSRNYYFLTSGRWFRNAELVSGKWAPATASLPDDFKNIPVNHPRAHVLASIPGTRQAEDAVLAASVPRIATIDRKTAKAEVQYAGDPKFEPIAGTQVSYAVNTPNDVLQVGDAYYLCLQGVWFVSNSAKGPWATADRVPDEIYTIPPESPKNNVTYVNVYESTPETVAYGYTAGYEGVYYAYGVAMWGTGYYYPPYYGGWGYYGYPVYWPAAYYTYGASAWYNPASGAYVRGGSVYGPYGGYGRAAAYNPSTGNYAWGKAAWGPYGAAASGGFYNPNTKTWGGSYQASNGYQSWGQSVVGRGDQWARTGSYSDSRGTVGAARTSSGGAAVAARGSQGQGQGFVARSGAGDLYAGRDGNVYKRDGGSGDWYRNNGGSWESVNRSSGERANAGSRADVQGLNRDAAARSWGNSNAQRSSFQSGNFGGGSRAGGGGFAARGGGGRRR
jgi:hypothetical protein